MSGNANVAADGGTVKLKKQRILNSRAKRILFFSLCSAPFIIQFLIFYCFVNINSISLAFQEYELVTGQGFVGQFVWFENFKFIARLITMPENVGMIWVSLLMYAFILLVATPLAIIFSFYIYKKMFFAEFFRVVLFLPQVISTVVMSALYSYIVGDVYMQVSGAQSSLLYGDTSTAILTVIFYMLWMGFGGNILLYSGAMSGIDPSLVEASHLDGCGVTGEFWHITMPSVYPTFVTFIVVDIAAIFTNQMNLYTFFGQNAPEAMRSIGYFMYVNTYKSTGLANLGGSAWLTFPQISAMGLMITLILLPITLIVRRVLNKVGPSEG